MARKKDDAVYKQALEDLQKQRTTIEKLNLQIKDLVANNEQQASTIRRYQHTVEAKEKTITFLRQTRTGADDRKAMCLKENMRSHTIKLIAAHIQRSDHDQYSSDAVMKDIIRVSKNIVKQVYSPETSESMT